MLIAWVPILAVIVGLLLWILPTPPKIQRAGEIVFAAGILVTLMATAHNTVTLIGK